LDSGRKSLGCEQELGAYQIRIMPHLERHDQIFFRQNLFPSLKIPVEDKWRNGRLIVPNLIDAAPLKPIPKCPCLSVISFLPAFLNPVSEYGHSSEPASVARPLHRHAD